MPIQTEYVYDYLGMRFQLGEEVNRALEEGKTIYVSLMQAMNKIHKN